MEPGGSQYSQMGKTRLYFLPRPARESRREAPRHYVILSIWLDYLRLSTRTALFMDRCHNFTLVSTEMPLFMDITAKPTVLFILPCLFLDSEAMEIVLLVLTGRAAAFF